MGILDLFFDRRCCLCEKHIDKGVVCDECDRELLSLIKVRKRDICLGNKNVELYYIFDYDVPVVKKLLFRLKRSSNSEIFRYAAKLYYMAVPENFSGTVFACPRRKKNLMRYGYDHVEIPCKIMCKENSEKLEFSKLLKRTGNSKEQKNLSFAQRKENAKGIFKVIQKDIPKNILIVDDVVTTASTMCSCMEEILKSRSDVGFVAVCLASKKAFPGK